MRELGLIRFAGFALNPAARSLTRDGDAIFLNSKTFELLMYLAAHPHQVVPKDQLMAALWPDSFVEESNLTQQIFLLRKALAGSGQGDRIVITVPGKGYQFAASIEQTEPPDRSEPSEPVRPPGPPAGELRMHAVQTVTRMVMEEQSDDEVGLAGLPAPLRGPKFWWWVFATGVAAVLAVGSAVLWQHRHAKPARYVDLVLSDLENRTGDPDFDRTLNQALQIDLEQSPYLHLLSRSRVQQTLVEMQRKADDPLIPAVANEVCERNNALVMLHGLVSKFGNTYLLILDADSCVTGKQVAGYKAEASTKEDVLRVLDKAAARVRGQLGESAASLDQYQIPIAQATTPSLDALRAYSEAEESFRRGDMKETQTLLAQAIAFDPRFASAYRVLGSSYYNIDEFAKAAEFYKKAFDLRDRTTERERSDIETMYYAYSLNDFEESIRRTNHSLQIYPNVIESWLVLCDLYTQLGEYPQAIEAGKRALQLDPRSGVASVDLARAYLRASRFEDAKRIANAAVAAGKDLWILHSILFQVAYAEDDAATIKGEGEWGLAHWHIHTSLYDLAFAAASAGKLREATADIYRARAEALRNGDQEAADGVLLDLSSILIDMEEPEKVGALLKQRNSQVEDPEDVAFLYVFLGQPAFAEHILSGTDPAAEHDTVKFYITRPILRSIIALEAKKPAEAVAYLELARPYQLRDYSVLYWRAMAETDAGLVDAAAKDYRLILDHPGINPISPEYSLSHLRLARVFSLQQKRAPALAEYQSFFQAWKDADADLPLLVRAKEQYAALIAAR